MEHFIITGVALTAIGLATLARNPGVIPGRHALIGFLAGEDAVIANVDLGWRNAGVTIRHAQRGYIKDVRLYGNGNPDSIGIRCR